MSEVDEEFGLKDLELEWKCKKIEDFFLGKLVVFDVFEELDFFVFKVGFFCLICFFFYLGEKVMINYCKSICYK